MSADTRPRRADGVNAARAALGIRSPSQVFAAIGLETVAGFIAGITAARPQAALAVDQLVTAPAAPTVDPGTTATADPAVNLTALVRIGGGPVLDAVETAVSRDPERFAQHVRTGQRSLTRCR